MLALSILFVFLIHKSVQFSLFNNEQYAVIFDAGSKGTRMYVFKIQSEQKHFEEILFCELDDGGLGSYSDFNQIEEYFPSCLQKANDLIPSKIRSDAYLSLFATAGMRLLEVKNRKFAHDLMNHIRTYFSQTGYYFKDPQSQVRVISGQEEGSLSFISANYFHPTPRGILDLGGASAQIAFVPSNQIDDYLIDVKVSSKYYRIYSHSFLCFGTNQIITMYNTKTIKDSNYGENLFGSCYPDGAEFVLTKDEILESPCVNGLMFDQTHDFTIDKDKIQSHIYRINGNSKKDKCRDEVNRLVRKKCQNGNECLFNGVYLPSIEESQFFALGNFYEAFDLTSKLLRVNLKNDMKAFNESTHLLCSMSYSKLKQFNKDNNADIGKKRLAKLCLENVYILKLWDLFGFQDLKSIDAVETINGTKISWITGHLMQELNNHNGKMYEDNFMNRLEQFVIKLIQEVKIVLKKILEMLQ